MLQNIALSIIGLIMLAKCADLFVDSSASFARNFNVSTTVIGLTIVSFGTSAPELAISFNAHLSGNTDMLFGNVIGSSISNVLVILGLTVLIKPFKIKPDVIRKQIPILVLTTIGFSILLLDTLLTNATYNGLSRADGMILLLIFSIFIYYLITIIRCDKEMLPLIPPKYKLSKSILLIVLGLGGILIGSHLVVENVEAIATSIGVSQKIISITVISIGTSLPELVTTVVAAKKGENEIAIGNIVGANIFNICVVLGMPVLVIGEAVAVSFGVFDVLFMIFSVVMLWITSATGRMIKRAEAVVFLVTYAGYLVYVLM